MPRVTYIFKDFKCADEHVTRKFVTKDVVLVSCEKCGEDAILPALYDQAFAVIGDEVDYIDNNLGQEPIRIRSKAERKRLMKERGLVEFIRHTPVPGTDLSPHTTDWSRGMDPYTLEQAKILAARQGGPSEEEQAKAARQEEVYAPVSGAFAYEVEPAEAREVAKVLGIEIPEVVK